MTHTYHESEGTADSGQESFDVCTNPFLNIFPTTADGQAASLFVLGLSAPLTEENWGNIPAKKLHHADEHDINDILHLEKGKVVEIDYATVKGSAYTVPDYLKGKKIQALQTKEGWKVITGPSAFIGQRPYIYDNITIIQKGNLPLSEKQPLIVANSTAFRIEEIVPPALGIPAIVIEQGGKFIHAKRKTITDRSGTYTTYVDSTGKRVRISGPLTIRVDTGNVSILSEDKSHLGPMVSKKPQAYNPFSPRENQQTPSKDIALPSKAMPQTPPENSSSTFTVYVPPSSEISREPLMSTFADVDTFMARESTTVMLNPTINFTQEDHDNAQKFLEEEAEKAAWDVLTSEEKQRTLLVRDLIKKNPALEKLGEHTLYLAVEKHDEVVNEGLIDPSSPSGQHMLINNFQQPSNEPRVYMINIHTKQLELQTYTTHGNASTDLNNPYLAGSFSNVKGSEKTPLGFFLTANRYARKRETDRKYNGMGMELIPLEMGNAHKSGDSYYRGILIHGWGPKSLGKEGRYRDKPNNDLWTSDGCMILPDFSDTGDPILSRVLKYSKGMLVFNAHTEYEVQGKDGKDIWDKNPYQGKIARYKKQYPVRTLASAKKSEEHDGNVL